MKIRVLKNIIPVTRIYGVLLKVRGLQMQARKAREAGEDEKEQELIRQASIKWSRTLISEFGASVEVEGYENLPEKGPVVFVCNHQSYGDIPAICSVLDKFQFGFLAKKDLERLPAYNTWMRDTRTLFLERGNSREALKTINEAVSLIERGYSFLVFAEGTRSQGRPMRMFKKGSLKIATKAEVPIIPLTLSGTYKWFEYQGYFKGGPAHLVIHEPIETKGISRHEQAEITDKVFWVIRDGLNRFEPQPELPPDENGVLQEQEGFSMEFPHE